MPRKKRNPSIFSERLANIRKTKGLTQTELAQLAKTTQRAISHYETEAYYPPAPVLLDLADALNISIEDLIRPKISKKTLKDEIDPETLKLWKKIKQVSKLPEKDRRALIRMINSLIKAYSK